MFDRQRSIRYATRPENDEDMARDFPPPPSGRPGRAPGRFWTQGRLVGMAVVAILLLIGIVCISETIAIQQRQYDIQGNIGNVWNEVDRAAQLLQQDAALLNATIAAQNEAINSIARARSNAASIKASQGTTDPNAALAAAAQMNGGIRAFVENYPDYGVGSNTHTVLVQIEGSFNRIEYARGQLIQAQTAFNKWLVTQIPMNLFYHPVQIVGANANPTETVPVPPYVQPTPAP